MQSLITEDMGTLVNATENDDKKMVVSPDEVMDRVSFLFNNLGKANLPQKACSFTLLTQPDWCRLVSRDELPVVCFRIKNYNF